MITLGRTFLVRSRRIAVKYASPRIPLPVPFYGYRIGELGTIVSQTERKEFCKAVRSQFQIQLFKDIYDRL